MSYAHLTQDERYQIYAYKQVGKSISEIAAELDRNKSTISRELAKNVMFMFIIQLHHLVKTKLSVQKRNWRIF